MPVSLLNLKTRSTVSRPAVSPNVTPKSPLALRLEVAGERGELAALELLLEAVRRRHVRRRHVDLAARDRLRRLETGDLRIDEGGLAEHRVELAVVCADYRAAEVLRALPWRSAVEKGPDLELLRPGDTHRLRLEKPRHIKALVVNYVPKT